MCETAVTLSQNKLNAALQTQKKVARTKRESILDLYSPGGHKHKSKMNYIIAVCKHAAASL